MKNIKRYHLKIKVVGVNLWFLHKALNLHMCIGLQHACSAPAACTDWLENSNTSHGVCDIEKLTNDIHIDILKMNMQRVSSQPAACLQHACSVSRVFKVHNKVLVVTQSL